MPKQSLHNHINQSASTAGISPILTVSGLSISIAERSIIRNAHFSLQPKASLALIGPNGSGKTLLLKALLGLQSYTGVITWQPEVKLGYVPQHLSADPHLPLHGRELLEGKADVLELPKTEAASAAAWVGSSDLLDQRLGTLSTGQLQRVLIAFALIGAPNVLLVDEPTSSLDEQAEGHFVELLRRARAERGTTVILVSHDLTLVRGFASHVLCLNGHEAFFGPATRMLVPEVLDRVYRQPVEFHSHTLEYSHEGRSKSDLRL